MNARLQHDPTPVEGVDHIQLPIDPGGSPAARHFYQDLLGLHEVRDPLLDRPGTLRFSLGAHRLDLTEGRYTGVAPQAHLALRVRGLGQVAHRLQAAGLPIDRAPLPGGEDRLYVDDPFRNRLELIEPAVHAPGPDFARLRFSR